MSLDFSFSGLHDGDAKEKVFLQLLHDLPNENYYCIVAIVEHLVRYISTQYSKLYTLELMKYNYMCFKKILTYLLQSQ